MSSRSTKKRVSKGFDPEDESVFTEKDKIRSILYKKLNIKAKNKIQKEVMNMIVDKEINFITGVAGTGKTFITLATALDLLANPDTPYTKIYLIKSVKTLQGEELGFMKGTLAEKLEPVMWSFMMNVSKLVKEMAIMNLMEQEIVKFLPLAYIRGLSIDNAIIILDETQNISIDTLRTLLTRIGNNSKLIALGDTKQIDMKNKSDSALEIAVNLFKDVEEIGVMGFSNDEIVRNPIIKIIEEKFDEYDLNNPKLKNNRR